jgi:AP2 domain
MKTICLTQGFVALVDDADYDRVSAHKWSATKVKNTVYGIRKIRTDRGRTTSQLLHRFITGVTDPSIDVDHEDHNGLNNQRYNLRKTVRGEHDGNRRKTHGSSQYKGVSWSKGKGKWRACIRIEKTVHLGYFTDEKEAAVVYDTAARSRFGIFAKCNFPLQE